MIALLNWSKVTNFGAYIRQKGVLKILRPFVLLLALLSCTISKYFLF